MLHLPDDVDKATFRNVVTVYMTCSSENAQFTMK
jgi:hypothetical protein